MNDHKLTVCKIEAETTLSKLITFEIPKELRSNFKFKPGQFISITWHDQDSQKQIRCYSICSIPKEGNITIGVKKVINGIVSTYLVDHLIVGRELNVGIPAGKFTVSSSIFHFTNYVFIAGGSGITPIKSIIHQLLESEPFCRITLIYGNYNKENIIFYDFFNSRKSKNFNVIHCLEEPSPDWNGETGRLNKIRCLEIIRSYNIPYSKAKFYLCGPGVMMTEALSALNELGVSKKNIFQEDFTSPRKPAVERPLPKKIKVIVNHQEQEVVVNPAESILDAALKAGLGINFSCKSGVCSLCAAKLQRGDVFMGLETALTPKEKQANIILTCQARPLTDDVIVEYNDALTNPKQKQIRKPAIVTGLFIVIILNIYFIHPDNQALLCKGPMNKGHENLACASCHSKAPGTTRQQIQASIKNLIGLREKPVDFGLTNVDNGQCLTCHIRPNDRHPTHRFLEPRFLSARTKLHTERCETCHTEHTGMSITITDFTYCQNCHQDLAVKNDPVDVPHHELIASKKWSTCVQCHDYHGNHLRVTPIRLQDTLKHSQIKIYWQGGQDPYGLKKKFVVETLKSN